MRKLIAKIKKSNVLHTGAFMNMVGAVNYELEYEGNFVMVYADVYNEVIKGNDE